MKAVFDTKPGSGYDDDVTQRYHFPRRYAATVDRAINDWVVLRRPRAEGGNLAYFAVARVARVDPDPSAADRAYARLTDFLPFDEPVPWLVADRYAEDALRQQPRHQVGLYLRGRSVRPLEDADFADIVALGLRDTIDPANAHRYGLHGTGADLLGFGGKVHPRERTWRIQEALTSRIVREASFRRNVCRAFDDRCAITGLRLINGGGRSEVHAAHIVPVASGGPDVIQNGNSAFGNSALAFRSTSHLTDGQLQYYPRSQSSAGRASIIVRCSNEPHPLARRSQALATPVLSHSTPRGVRWLVAAAIRDQPLGCASLDGCFEEARVYGRNSD